MMCEKINDCTYITKYYINEKYLQVIETNYYLGTQKEYLEKVSDDNE